MNLPNKKHFYLTCFLLAIVTFATFAQVLRCEFINFDDPDYVTENNLVQRGITWEGIAWAFQTGRTGNWHPVTWISHMLDCQFFGVQPAGHHFTNLVFHIANTVLLFSIFTSATGAMWRSALVAALFALHPLHVESVAWVSERKDVLSTFFLLLALGSYFRYAITFAETTEPPIRIRQRRTNYFVALFFFALGLMSKPMLVTLPFLFLLLDYWPLRRIQFPPLKLSVRLIHEKIPFFALSFLSSVVTFYVQKEVGAVSSLTHISLMARLANAVVSYCRYLLKTFWPVDLAVLYPLREVAIWQSLSAALFLAFVTVVAIRVASRHPYFVTGWFWFLGTLVPVIGLVQVGSQSMADRYSYVPLIGIFIALIWGIHEFTKTAKPLAIILSAIAIVACAVGSRIQVQYWQNAVTIFERALAVTKDNFTAHLNLGVMLGKRGNVSESIEHYRAALKLQPGHGETHYNLANALARIGETTEAISHYQAALRAKPTDAEAHNNLASVFQSQGEILLAIKHFQDALHIQPDYPEAHYNLALILIRQQRIPEAIIHLNEALRAQLGNEQAHYQLGTLLVGQGRLELAIIHFREAVKLKPDWPIALNYLARILATSRDPKIRNGEEAVKLAGNACKLVNFENIAYLDTLGTAYAEKGDFAEAIRAAEKAKDLAMAAGQKAVGEQIELHIHQYRSGQPLREFENGGR